jgi:hypothetical protein
VDVIVFVRRSSPPWKQVLWDPVNAEVRRYFIKKFLTADAIRLNGVRYNPAGLIDADRDMANYLAWVAIVSHGKPAAPHDSSNGKTTEPLVVGCGDQQEIEP